MHAVRSLNFHWLATSCVAVSALLALAGCDSDSKVGSVRGVVRLDGKPLATGTVRFLPKAGRAATGKIRSDGTYRLGTYGESDGALIGKHEVAIIALEIGPVPTRTEGGRPPATPTKPLVPRRYMSPGSSGLTFDVQPGNNQADFDLTSQ
jgi:hypothetical protein